MPEAGDYLLSHVGFTKNEKPYVSLQKAGSFYELAPLSKTLTLRFDTSQRFCIGWRNITSGERFVCPGNARLEGKYEQCPSCQKRTGFNPAFYHAASVSTQQEAYNLEPHFLYLAHFGAGTVKVGLSYAARGNSRLLEQGARSALILDTFPTAHVARQYEARIARLPGITETIQMSKKIECLAAPYDLRAARTELENVRNRISETLSIQFSQNDVVAFDSLFFPADTPAFDTVHNCSDHAMISGQVAGMLGSLLFCRQQEQLLFLPLKKYVGYNVALLYEEVAVELPPKQISLF